LIQALSLPTGSKNVFIEKIKEKLEQSPNYISPKNIRIYSSLAAYQPLRPMMIRDFEFLGKNNILYQRVKTISTEKIT